MVEGLGKTGAIVGIVSSVLSIVSFSITVLFMGLVFTMAQYSGALSELNYLDYDSETMVVLIMLVIVGTIFYCMYILQVIALSLTIKYLQTGRYKVASGVLNILSLSIIGIVSGILILVYKGEPGEKFNYSDYVEAG